MAVAMAACQPLSIDDATRVQVSAEANVQQCQRLGIIQVVASQTRRGESREDDDIAFELRARAKERAFVRGGDTVVEEGPILGGRQSFAVYRCETESTRENSPVVELELEKTI